MRQLIFTSALTGVAPGRSGFCTVARHASLRDRTVAELERMSVYEPPEGTRPTVFLFRVYSGRTEPLYILTRAGDAGTDAFGRPNHIVHHLIFRKTEVARLLPPAEVALRFRGWCKKYEGEPTLFETEDALPDEILRSESESLLPAKRWEALTGNAGNAALLCPHGDARSTIFVSEESRTEEVLGLFAESAEVAGAANAWEIAFSTGICSQGRPGRFLWRLVHESELSARCPGDFIVDFLAPLGFLRPPKTIFAEYARSGVLPTKRRAENAPSETLSEAASQTQEELHAQLSPDALNEDLFSAEDHRMRFADIAGTAKFLGISVGILVVILIAIFFLTPRTAPLKNHRDLVEIAKGNVPETALVVEAYQKLLDAKIERDDFCGATETWVSFADAFPQEAEKVQARFFPKFRMKVAGAYAERLAERMKPLDFGGKLSPEEKQLLAADLAMFRRAQQMLDLTLRQVQNKNLAVISRAEAVCAD